MDRWEIEWGLIEGLERDPRGFLLEPHTGNRIPLGTKAVDDYTIPFYLYDTILYFEKKGLEGKLAWGKIGERYDCAIMASEGYAVRAAKSLLQAAQGRKKKVLCFHDADPDGKNIKRTLGRSTGAHKFNIEIIDCGLNLEEALEMGLPTETFTRKKALPSKLELTELEREYFTGEGRFVYRNGKLKTHWVNCQRVELNARSAGPSQVYRVGGTRRVALLDNVKSLKFSWAELEGTITSSIIGGKRMYVGEATRPNTLVWFITLNGAALSTDMAQRSVIIKVKKPERSATWEETTRQFIQQHQRDIIADLIAVLRGPQGTLPQFSRWATWERDILQRLPEPSDAQKVILERQGAVDVDEEESTLIEDYFADQLRGFGYDVDTDRVFIPSQVTARWFCWATNQHNITAIAASRMLSQLATEGRLRRLSICSGRSWGRGFVWTGEKWPGMHTNLDLKERIRERQKKDAKDDLGRMFPIVRRRSSKHRLRGKKEGRENNVKHPSYSS